MNKILNRISCFMGFHDQVLFKHLDSYLIACYCKHCSVVKVGNPLYFDGTVYQTKYTKQKSVDFINKDIEYVKNMHDFIDDILKNFPINLIVEDLIIRRYELLDDYETIEKLEEIKKHILHNFKQN